MCESVTGVCPDYSARVAERLNCAVTENNERPQARALVLDEFSKRDLPGLAGCSL